MNPFKIVAPLLALSVFAFAGHAAADEAGAPELPSFASAMPNKAFKGIADSRRGPRAVNIVESDNGKTIEARKGLDIVVSLGASPSAGYSWKVTSTDRSFGYPVKDEFIADNPNSVGGGGIQKFTWTTNQPFLSAGGTHRVTLAYGRSWENKPEKTFTFTVRLK